MPSGNQINRVTGSGKSERAATIVKLLVSNPP